MLLNNAVFGNTNSSLAYWIAVWTDAYSVVPSNPNIIEFVGIGEQIITSFKVVGEVIYSATYLILTPYVSFLIGYLLAKKRNQELAVIIGLVTLGVFLISGGITVYWQTLVKIGTKFLGVDGLFSAIIISFLGAELLLFLSRNNRLAIKMPKGMASIVSQSFAKLLPILIVIVIFAIVSQLFITVPIQQAVLKEFNRLFDLESDADTVKAIVKDTEGNIFYAVFVFQADDNSWFSTVIPLARDQMAVFEKVEYLSFTGQGYEMWGNYEAKFDNYALFTPDINALNLVAIFYKFFAYPFMNFSANPNIGLGLAIVYVFFGQLFWFFGLSGTNIMNGIFGPVWGYAIVQNSASIKAGLVPQFIFNESFFNSFIFIGGWGMSLSLLLVSLLIGRDKRARTISKMALVPTIYNINHPITFSYPLILNPIFFIPAVIGPVLLVIWTWLWMMLGYVPYASLQMSFLAPVGVGAILATSSWKAIILVFSNLILGMVIYVPFILIANSIAKKNGNAVNLVYLGAIHYFFTGKNFQDLRYQEIRNKHRSEYQILKKNDASIEEKQRLREKHIQEWIIYRKFLKKERIEIKKRQQQEKLQQKIELKAQRTKVSANKNKDKKEKKLIKKNNQDLKKAKKASKKAKLKSQKRIKRKKK